jgi:putative transposase
VNRCAIVTDDDDRRRLIATLRDAAAAHEVAVHGFVVMDTHYHVIVTPPADGVLSSMMKKLGEDYVLYFNRRQERIGTLWTGRFRSIPLDDPRQWLTCMRYIELNPVAAKIVTSPERYRWSSYRFHANGDRVPWLVPHPVYLGLGGTPAERQTAYRAVCVE